MEPTLRLSSRQFAMLKTFAGQAARQHMSQIEVGSFNQTTFRSMLYRKWVAWDGTEFFMTRKGRQAIADFETGEILRKVASSKLTSFFYGLRKVRYTSAA